LVECKNARESFGYRSSFKKKIQHSNAWVSGRSEALGPERNCGVAGYQKLNRQIEKCQFSICYVRITE
jgi:hypothetical protein